MRHGFIKVAAVTPVIKVADTKHNCMEIKNRMLLAANEGAKIIVFPELCLTAYTCQDLFFQDTLLDAAKESLGELIEASSSIDALIFVGLPLEVGGKLYNVAAVMNRGTLLAFVPKKNIPNYGEFYEMRHFEPFQMQTQEVVFDGIKVPMGTDLLFSCKAIEGLNVACEICEDLWAPQTPSTNHALAGATVIVNLSASNEVIGKDSYREDLVKMTCARLMCGYIYACAGEGESTQDLVFAGHSLIGENGRILAKSRQYCAETLVSDLDIERIRSERRRNNIFSTNPQNYQVIPFNLGKKDIKLCREFPKAPFVPGDPMQKQRRCEEILSIQAHGLKRRLEHTNSKTVILGLSGGLDSTLALLVAVRAFDLLKLPREGIMAITMPCFGTTSRTYQNAIKLSKVLGAHLTEINIMQSVKLHLQDIEHDLLLHDITYENAQARERTQVLMDLANKYQGFVIGTGDLSELALGWATYNGDHMSMYAVNVGVPKTLVRHLVQYVADDTNDETLQNILSDVLDTPVSPELLPPIEGDISQKTEDLVGPYELHDFFLYYMMRFHYPPDKIYRIACKTFQGMYTNEEIKKWIQIFYQRFFSQQFKRSCLPDGPKVGTVAVSPRGDLRMPSDACARIWLEQLVDLN